jgi:uncharacterized protein with PIN domain
MSTVNYAEVIIFVQDRQPAGYTPIRREIEAQPFRFVPPTARQGEIAAAARLKYPLNLGDSFCYALAKEEECPWLTLYRDFRRLDVPVILPQARQRHLV